MKEKIIAIASDHAGYELKNKAREHLEKRGWEVDDLGSFKYDPVDDYPDFAHKIAKSIEEGKYNRGISLCGTGNGISIVANKHQGIRSAVCWNKEMADLAVRHNDANICALPARFLSDKKAIEIIDAYLNAAFDGGRHERRIKKIPIQSK